MYFVYKYSFGKTIRKQNEVMIMAIVAIDPGRDKCGMAILSATGEILRREVVPTDKREIWLVEASERYDLTAVVLGNGTTGKQAADAIARALPGIKITVVDEYRTTEMARREYWRVNPPKGWRRFLPEGLLYPPEPVDDLVAVILGRRFLQEGG